MGTRGRVRTRKDVNHDEVVAAFRQCGCPTMDTHMLGRGFPDILVFCKEIRMVEIKNTATPYGRRGLTENQRHFNEAWGGLIYECDGPDRAIALVKEWRGGNQHTAIAAPSQTETAPKGVF